MTDLRRDLDHISAEAFWQGERSPRNLYNELVYIAARRTHKQAADFLELVMSGFRSKRSIYRAFFLGMIAGFSIVAGIITISDLANLFGK